MLSHNFGVSQQDFGRFPLAGEQIIQRPTFFLSNKPLPNDDFTRNLVPPPRTRGQQKNKDTKISYFAFKEGPVIDAATSSVPQFGARPNQFLPAFEFSQQKIVKPQATKEKAVDVQVTKETLKQYTHNTVPVAYPTAPGRGNVPIGYVDYNFEKSPNSPSPLTYEVPLFQIICIFY